MKINSSKRYWKDYMEKFSNEENQIKSTLYPDQHAKKKLMINRQHNEQ